MEAQLEIRKQAIVQVKEILKIWQGQAHIKVSLCSDSPAPRATQQRGWWAWRQGGRVSPCSGLWLFLGKDCTLILVPE